MGTIETIQVKLAVTFHRRLATMAYKHISYGPSIRTVGDYLNYGKVGKTWAFAAYSAAQP